MKTYDHTEEVFQNGKFNCDDVSYIEQDEENSNYIVVLKKNDEREEEEIHIFRSSCIIGFHRNFHSMFIVIG